MRKTDPTYFFLHSNIEKNKTGSICQLMTFFVACVIWVIKYQCIPSGPTFYFSIWWYRVETAADGYLSFSEWPKFVELNSGKKNQYEFKYFLQKFGRSGPTFAVTSWFFRDHWEDPNLRLFSPRKFTKHFLRIYS